jgi:dTMP kinase
LTARGRFIVFEGGEGTGKSTQARLLTAALQAAGIDAIITREPGGAPGADVLRRLLLLETPPQPGWSPLSEALLHYAARAEHLDKTIRPALSSGRWVVCDRFADSTAAYQGAGLGVPDETLATLRRLVVAADEPDLVVVLDVPVEAAFARVAARSPAVDRYEMLDVSFHRRIREAFLAFAARAGAGYAVVDGQHAPGDVAASVRVLVSTRLGVHLG